jgi:uncharacterized protein (DUF1499 family)
VPDTLGEHNGTLAPCPGTPNCVQTGLRRPDGTRGMYLRGSTVRSQVMPSIQDVVESLPRVTIVTVEDRYLHAEVRSRIFRFVDDLEILIAVDGELIVRSASRVGRSDMGVNAERVERLRAALSEAGLIR